MEWKLFSDNIVPMYTSNRFFEAHPWVDPIGQRGHAERTDMVADFAAEVIRERGIKTVTDLGCGDGALIQKVQRRVPVEMWGYDLGAQNLHVATQIRMVDVRRGDILKDTLEYGELITATEVVEHLLKPREFIQGLPGKLVMLSSPWDEHINNHYCHHAWAWDAEGYAQMVEDCGWSVKEQRTCPEGFQAVFAERP